MSGIANLPPGFDVFGGKRAEVTLVERILKGEIAGVGPSQQELFRDMKRHLQHMDYARYFEATMTCAEILKDLREGEYLPVVLSDIVQPAIRVASDQMESIRTDFNRAQAAQRTLEYDAQSCLDRIHRKSEPIAKAYPAAEGADRLEPLYAEVSRAIQASQKGATGPP